MKAKDLKARFELKLFKEDDHYIYLDIKPSSRQGQAGVPATATGTLRAEARQLAYLPAQVYMVKPNDETEQWKLTNPKTNIQGIDAEGVPVRERTGIPLPAGARRKRAAGSTRRPPTPPVRPETNSGRP